MLRLRFLLIVVVTCVVLAVGIGLLRFYLFPPPRTLPVPPTQTSCPKAGTARAAITAPLVLGTHQNVVYIFNEPQGNSVTSPGYGSLQRYDTTTGKTTVIVKMPYIYFLMAQVSVDGQWILFVAQRLTNRAIVDELRMIRMDGQGLQTLYCVDSNNLAGAFYPPLAWSPDQKLLAFTLWNSTICDSAWCVYLLDLSTGKLLPEIIPQQDTVPQAIPTYIPWEWLDNTRLYLTNLHTNPPAIQSLSAMYLLDIKNGPNQRIENLQSVVDVLSSQCWGYDLSSDHTRLFTVTIPCNNTGSSPSIISVQSSTGGSPMTIYSSSTLAITNIQVVNPYNGPRKLDRGIR
jgi:hypothetical protein